MSTVGLSEQRDQARARFGPGRRPSRQPGRRCATKHLLPLAAGKGEEEGTEETPLSMAIDAVDHWNGRDKDRASHFAEREPKDDVKILAWNARKAKHEATVKSRPGSDRRRPGQDARQ